MESILAPDDKRTQSLHEEHGSEIHKVKALVEARRRELKTQLEYLKLQCGVEAAGTQGPVCIGLDQGRQGPSTAGQNDQSGGSVGALAILEKTAEGDTPRKISQKEIDRDERNERSNEEESISATTPASSIHDLPVGKARS
jgi:hypothetical protein